MSNEIKQGKLNKNKVIKKIALISVVLVIFAGLCLFFFTTIDLESEQSAIQMALFIGASLFFVIGLIGIIMPLKFHNILYLLGAKLLSKSINMDYMGFDVVSQKKSWKYFLICMISFLAISNITLLIIILVNTL